MNDRAKSSSIACQGLVKRFGAGETVIEVINDVTATIYPGDEVAIVGSSGSGKTTLLQLLGGLDRPTGGSVCWNGVDLKTMSLNTIARQRNELLGFVYQFHHLLPEFTALENVSMPLRVRRIGTRVAMERAKEALSAVGLANRFDHLPAQLSGGERQRVAIARAIVGEPAYVLADEPTGNLDRKTAESVFDLLKEIKRFRDMALIVVTHDPAIASSMARQWQLVDGRLVSESEV